MTWFLVNNNGKNCNQNNTSRNRNSNKTNMFVFLLAGLLLIFLALFILPIWIFSLLTSTDSVGVIILNSKESLLQTTSSKFLSFAIDASLFRNMNNLPILNNTFINLARHLSPAYVRFGGTSADCLFFNQISLNTSIRVNPINDEDISNFTITEKDFLSLYEFSRRSNLQMLFDLNVLIRNVDGSWDDSNARKIILFAKNNEMVIDWQLGNEPPSFPLIFNLTISPEQLAKDYYRLRSLLDSSGYKESILVGPEVNQVGGSSQRGELYAKEFLKNSGYSVNYVTWHQYYMRGEDAQVKDFINATTFNYLSSSIKSMETAVDSSGNKIPMWLSETSTAYDEGAPGISDRFVAGFLWLDKLGCSAKAGIQVVIRQSFFGENYGMISSDLAPNPDWWVSVVFKKFVSNKVLNLSIPDNFGNLRLYAHCTPEKALFNFRFPAITIFGVNLDKNPTRISTKRISLVSEDAIFVYALTSDSLQSRSIQMNGEVLKLLSNGDLPPFKPLILKSRDIISLPAYSMIFVVVHGTNVSAC